MNTQSWRWVYIFVSEVKKIQQTLTRILSFRMKSSQLVVMEKRFLLKSAGRLNCVLTKSEISAALNGELSLEFLETFLWVPSSRAYSSYPPLTQFPPTKDPYWYTKQVEFMRWHFSVRYYCPQTLLHYQFVFVSEFHYSLCEYHDLTISFFPNWILSSQFCVKLIKAAGWIPHVVI